jgi:hypothetical protein
MDVKITWDEKAIEAVKQEAIRNVEKRLSNVHCPVHGTRVTLDQHKQPVQTELCCDELAQAIKRALA